MVTHSSCARSLREGYCRKFELYDPNSKEFCAIGFWNQNKDHGSVNPKGRPCRIKWGDRALHLHADEFPSEQ